MATTQGKTDDGGAKSTDPKPNEVKAQDVKVPPVDNSDDAASNASKMVGYREGQVAARDAAIAAAEDARKAEADALKNAIPVEQAAFTPNWQNQVPQEGALVESPPQPVPPAYSDAELKEMDHAPEGLREPSIAKDSTDTDQTVHPESRVNDPSKPL
jgi:hypothetical protein